MYNSYHFLSFILAVSCCISIILELLNRSSHLLVFLFYVVGIIGFHQTAYTFGECDGTVKVVCCNSGSAPNVAVELMGSTFPSTYPCSCVNVK